MPAATPRRSRRTAETPPSSLTIRNVVVAGHRTSVRLEAVMWEALLDIARQTELTVHDLVTRIDRDRSSSLSLTAAIRVHIVNYYRKAALEAAAAIKSNTNFRL
ncbi:MAG TPA: ribbon-helix-helix domain-containing protein [Stellaceae bacterium]|jgi:predicted DNA-binding ribbon-helix-helix protein|nr:ribbon-helix-helix domain-containing protein [Stellaceae bacterium]